MILRPPPHRPRAEAFTLIEILLASMGAALVLAALYGIFIHAIKLRDTATDRVRDARLRARAEAVIRTDLQNAIISGGIIASSLEGGTADGSGPGGSSLPGYLKINTTTGRDTGSDPNGDLQQVEYYLTHDPDAPVGSGEKGSNILVRAVTRDLLATTASTAREEQILRGVQSLAVEFYDGSTWQQAWSYDSTAAGLTNGGDTTGTAVAFGNTTLPDAVRIDVQQAPAIPNGHPPPPVEVLVPWTTQPFAGATPSSVQPVAATPTPPSTPTPPPHEHEPGEGPPDGPPNEPPSSSGPRPPR